MNTPDERCSNPELGRLLPYYEMGRLTAAERASFERHALECDACFQELERGAAVGRVLRDRLATGPAVPSPRATRWRPHVRRTAVPVLAVVLAATAMLFGPSPRRPDPARLARYPGYDPPRTSSRGTAAADPVAELLAAGAAHLELGHLSEAIARFRAARDRDPTSSEAAYALGLALARSGEPRRALDALAQAEQLGDAGVARRSRWVRANAYLALQETERARALLSELASGEDDIAALARATLARLGDAPGREAPPRPGERLGAVRSDRSSAGILRLTETADPRTVRAAIDSVLASARARDDLGQEVDAWAMLAAYLVETGFVEAAGENSQRLLEKARALGDERRILRAEALVARVEIARGRASAVRPTLDRVLGRARAAGDLRLEIETQLDLGIAHLTGGRVDSAVTAFEAGLARGGRRPEPRLEARLLQELGMAHQQAGDSDRGLEALARSIEISRAHALHRTSLGSLARLATIEADTERYSDALAHVEAAMQLAREIGWARAVANLLVTKGTVSLGLSRPDDALEAYEEALAVVRELRHPRFEAGLQVRIARARLALGDFAGAIRSLEEAAGTFARLESPLGVGNTLHDLGLAYLGRGDATQATRVLERGLAAVERSGRASFAADLRCHLTEAVLAGGDTSRAAKLLAELEGAGRYAADIRRRVLALEAQLLVRRGDLGGADARLAVALAVADSVRSRLAGDDLRIGFHASVRDLYLARVAVLYAMARRGDPAAARSAFHVAEQAHARALLDALGGVEVGPSAAAPAALGDRERQLAARVRSLQTALSREAGAERSRPAHVDSLERELRAIARQHREVATAIAARDPPYGEWLGVRPALDVDAVRARVLGPDQALVEYLVGDGESFVFVVARDRLEFARIPAGAAALEARVDSLRLALEGGAALPRPSAELYDLLLRPVRAQIPAGTRLLLVPDGVLHRLPFAVLHDGSGYLVETHALACAPSASVLDPDLWARSRRRPPELLAVGNPATFHEGEALAARRAALGWRLGELPYAEEEVRRVARHYARARVLVGEQATEEAVKRALRRATEAHFATHAIVDPHEPRLGGLVLAQDDDPTEDGFLQVHEIVLLPLTADLVVLSACNTGLGRLAGGEGVVGLTRAFFYAGARSLLLSLWEIGDRSAAELLDRFHAERFAAPIPADRALQAAQRHFLARGEPPRDWGAFVLAGEPLAVLPESAHRSAPRAALGVGLAALAVGLAALAVVRRRQARARFAA